MSEIESLRKKVEDAKLELARSEERLAQITKREEEINKAIEEEGSTPEKLVEDIKALHKEAIEEELRIKKLLEEAEKGLSGKGTEDSEPEPQEPSQDQGQDQEPEEKQEPKDELDTLFENLR